MNENRYFVSLTEDGFVDGLRVTTTEEETDTLLEHVPGLAEVTEEQAELVRNMTGRRWKKSGDSFVEYPDEYNKDIKWSVIKRARDEAEFGGFTWDGSVFDSDQISQSRIQGSAQLAILAQINAQPFETEWTLADNTVRVLNAQEMISVGQAMGIHIMGVHYRSRELRAQLDAAVTLEEIAAVNW